MTLKRQANMPIKKGNSGGGEDVVTERGKIM